MEWDSDIVDLDLIADAMLHARPDLLYYLDVETGSVFETERGEEVPGHFVEIPILAQETLLELAGMFLDEVDDDEICPPLRELLEKGGTLEAFEEALTAADPELALDWFQELDNNALAAAEEWLDSL